ncbi:MAG: TIGR02266 family protein [Thermodesulfobacteriota bacterium]
MVTQSAKNILLVDDSVFFRTKVADILAEGGHNVESANDGQEAVEKIQASPGGVDLLILDLQMPELDGFGVLEWIKKNNLYGSFPVMVITGAYDPGEVKERLARLGVRKVWTKDFSPEKIVFQVNTLLFPEKSHSSKRSAPRVPVSMQVDYSVKDAILKSFLLNISPGGLFLHTKKELKPGTVVQHAFSLPDSDRTIEAEGMVRWSSRGRTARSLFSGAGIMFTFIDTDDRKAIEKFVEAEAKNLAGY